MRTRLPRGIGLRICGFVAAALVCVWCLLAGPGVAQEKQPGKPADEKTELAEFLDDARHYVIKSNKPEAVLKLHEPPVLNFTNPERNQERGSVFVWLHEGRPAVLGQFFRFDVREARPKKHALHSLMTGPIEATFHDKLAWAPDQPGVEWKPFEGAPAVAATRNERLLQIRQFARRFKVDLIDPRDKVTELRLAPRPLFEYTAPKVGVTDGAFFSFFVATDPEAVLLVEAFDERGKTGFRYAFARFHFWRLTAKFDDRTVWDVEYDPIMNGNRFGNPAAMKKVYNSYHADFGK
jgi:hypothetical protein